MMYTSYQLGISSIMPKRWVFTLALLGVALAGCGGGGGVTGSVNNTNLTSNPTTGSSTGGTTGGTTAASLPLSFDDSAISYATTSIEGGSATVVADPAGGTTHGKVLQVTIAGQSTYDGVILTSTGNGLSTSVPFSSTATQITVDVYAPASGVPILLKAETADGQACTAVTANTTQANAWHSLTFEFKNAIAAGTGCTVPDTNKAYVKLMVLPNYGTKASSAQTYYFDNVAIGGTTTTPTAVFPLATGSGTALTSGQFASDYQASATGEGGAFGFYADSANTVQWWNGNAASNAPTTDPNMYFGYGAKPATGYIGGYVNAPSNGLANMVGFTKLNIGIWGNDELMNINPTYKVILQGATVSGCIPEVQADVQNATATKGVKYYDIAFTAMTVRQDCASVTNTLGSVAAILGSGIQSIHAQLLPPNMQFTTSGDPTYYPNGLNIGKMTFQ